MIKKFLNNKTNSITGAAIIIAVAGLMSRILGVVRDRVLAYKFGAGDELDIYYAAFQLPDFVFNLIVLGALSAGFIPIFISLIKDEEKISYKANQKAWDLVNIVLNLFGLSLLILSAILVLTSQWILPLILPGFSGDKLDQVISLTRIMFLSPFFLGLSAIFGGILQSYKRFVLFSLSPVLYNLGIIAGALILVGQMGLYGLAVGVVGGAFCHMVILIPSVLRLGWRYHLNFSLKDSNFWKILKMTGPRILALASNQINILIVTFLASLLPLGSLAIFNFANNLQSLPIGLFGVSFAVAAFPALSKSFASGKSDEFNNTFLHTFKQIVFWTIPLSFLLIVLRNEIVSVVLGSGQFGQSDIDMTANALAVFSLSLLAQALTPLLSRVYFSRHDTFTAFWVSLVSVAVNFIVSFILIKYWGLLGLAAGFSISAFVNFLILLIFIRFKAPEISFAGLAVSLLKITGASFVLLVVAEGVRLVSAEYIEFGIFWGNLIIGLGVGLIGYSAFVIAAYLLRTKELDYLFKAVNRKLFRRVKVEETNIQAVER